MIIDYCIRAAEAQTGESADFLRDIWRASGAALFKLALFLPLAQRYPAPAADHLSHGCTVACGPATST